MEQGEVVSNLERGDQFGYEEKVFYGEGLEQVAQKGGGRPVPEDIHSQARGSEQHDVAMDGSSLQSRWTR